MNWFYVWLGQPWQKEILGSEGAKDAKILPPCLFVCYRSNAIHVPKPAGPHH